MGVRDLIKSARPLVAGLCLTASLASVATANPDPIAADQEVMQGVRAVLAAGDRKAALSWMERNAERMATQPRALQILGDLRFHHGDRERALEAWNEALELAPSDSDLLERVVKGGAIVGDFASAAEAQKVRAELALTRWQQAGEGIEPAAATDALKQAWLQHLLKLCEVSVLAGDYSTGEEAARAYLEVSPEHVSGLLSLAYVHLQADDLDEAEAIYLHILKKQRLPEVFNNLGMIHYLRRDLDAAGEAYEAGLEIASGDPELESLLLSNLAELSMLRGQAKDAETLFRDAIEVAPEGAWSYMGLSAVLEIGGQHDEALDAMIDGWSRDDDQLNRLNTRFQEDEWYWHRDALIAEIEGDLELARALWAKVARGDVLALRAPAARHLESLAKIED